MNNYPRMSSEIMEALREYFKEDEDVLADCLVYLSNTSSDTSMLKRCSDELNEMKRCDVCGVVLEYESVCIHHPELDGGATYEYTNEVFCPNCDRGK